MEVSGVSEAWSTGWYTISGSRNLVKNLWLGSCRPYEGTRYYCFLKSDSKKLFSGSDWVILINSWCLWLSAQGLHEIGSLNISSSMGDGPWSPSHRNYLAINIYWRRGSSLFLDVATDKLPLLCWIPLYLYNQLNSGVTHKKETWNMRRD